MNRDDICVSIVESDDSRASVAENALNASGFPLPLFARKTWARHFGADGHKLAIAAGHECNVVAAAGLEHTRTRAIAGHWVLRLRALGDAYATPAGRAILGKVVEYAFNHGRIVKLVVELECRTEARRAVLQQVLVSLGFYRRPAQRIPGRTLALDLSESEGAIFSSFAQSARYEIRKADRLGLELESLKDPLYADRMNSILTETFARTGARAALMDWEAAISLSNDMPTRSRIVGVFHGTARAPANLIAYAWGIHHGDRAVYHVGASTRVPGVQMPLMYVVMWDLIRWAKREGAAWFDFGGVTQGASDSEDPLRRISDFKRRFCQNDILLGEEWIFEPNKMKAWIARVGTESVHWLKRGLGRTFVRTDTSTTEAVCN